MKNHKERHSNSRMRRSLEQIRQYNSQTKCINSYNSKKRNVTRSPKVKHNLNLHKTG